jgi:hypothetical protein
MAASVNDRRPVWKGTIERLHSLKRSFISSESDPIESGRLPSRPVFCSCGTGTTERTWTCANCGGMLIREGCTSKLVRLGQTASRIHMRARLAGLRDSSTSIRIRTGLGRLVRW